MLTRGRHQAGACQAPKIKPSWRRNDRKLSRLARRRPGHIAPGLRVLTWTATASSDFVSGIAVNSTGHSHPRGGARHPAAGGEIPAHLDPTTITAEPGLRLGERLDGSRHCTEEAGVVLADIRRGARRRTIRAGAITLGGHCFVGFMGGFRGRTPGSLGFTANRKITQRRGSSPCAGDASPTGIEVPAHGRTAGRRRLHRQDGGELPGKVVVESIHQRRRDVADRARRKNRSRAGIAAMRCH